MVKLRKNFPILLSITVTCIFVCILTNSKFVLELFPWALNGSEYRYQMCGEILTSLFAFLLVFFVGDKNVLKNRGEGLLQKLLLCWYLLYLIGTAVVSNIRVALDFNYSLAPFSHIAEFLITMVLVGITEEFIFRGFIAKSVFDKYSETPAQVWFSVLVSGAIFGFMHIVNAFSFGNLSSALVQSITATSIGMAYCAVFYRSGSLWLCVGLHAFNNIAALLNSGVFLGSSIEESLGSYTSLNLIAVIPYVALTVLLLRPEKMETLVKTKKESSRKFIVLSVLIAVLLFVTLVITAVALLPQTIEMFLNAMEYAI